MNRGMRYVTQFVNWLIGFSLSVRASSLRYVTQLKGVGQTVFLLSSHPQSVRCVTRLEGVMLSEKEKVQTALRQRRFRERRGAVRVAEQLSKGLPALPPIPSMPGHARWRCGLSASRAHLEQVVAEMRDYYSDRSEVWQEGEIGAAFSSRLEEMESVLSQLEDLML